MLNICCDCLISFVLVFYYCLSLNSCVIFINFSARVSKPDKDNLLNLAVSFKHLFIDNIELNQFDNPSFIGLNITLLINLYCGVQIIIVKY